MTRRPARFSQAEVARAIRAARQEGARVLWIKPDGSMLIDLDGGHGENPRLAKERIAGDREAVL